MMQSKTQKLIFWLCVPMFFYIEGFTQNFDAEIEAFRTKYKNDFLTNTHSPLKAEDLQHLDFYPADIRYRVNCKFKAAKKGIPLELPTSSGIVKAYFVFGKLTFKINGARQQLTVYRSQALMHHPEYKNYLFVPFKDLTNGLETYGGGRYLDLKMSDIESEAWLDFNKAYNPYCAFTDGYSCPIPPKENRLNVRIEAGERNFKKKKLYE